MIKTNFDTIAEYETYLSEKIKELNEKEEFNFFFHIVSYFLRDSQFTYKQGKQETIKQKTISILENGLSLCENSYTNIRYTSMNGTSYFKGSSKTISTKDFVNYCYDQVNEDVRSIVVIAVPKFIDYNNNLVEFSSYKGIHNFDFKNSEQKFTANELKKEFIKTSGCFDLRHNKFSLLDCTLGAEVPKEFILGVQVIDNKNCKVIFRENENHYSKFDKNQKGEWLANYQKKLNNLGLNSQASNTKEILLKRSKEDVEYYVNLLCEEI